MPSPATLFHDVLVVCDQTGEEWTAATAEVREGLVYVPMPTFTYTPGRTYTLTGRDGGERLRSFLSVTVEWPRSADGVVAFR
ncbi:MAG TPA: hypothetical protein VGF69_11580 [Thermoanaerobaculia bacterium]|jgi:hypothetical protein